MTKVKNIKADNGNNQQCDSNNDTLNHAQNQNKVSEFNTNSRPRTTKAMFGFEYTRYEEARIQAACQTALNYMRQTTTKKRVNFIGIDRSHYFDKPIQHEDD
jgi:hypothetical protein